MGPVGLPTSRVVSVDTQIVVYAIEGHPRYAPLLVPLWRSVAAGSVTLLASELIVMEALTGPFRNGAVTVTTAFERLFASSTFGLVPVSGAILRSAARLRAAWPSLRTPDALHAATALAVGCDAFITNDASFRRVPGLTTILLDEL